MEHELLAQLMDRLGYTFVDPDGLLVALTHRSYTNEHGDESATHNERLEFLGDAVVNLCVGWQLMEMLPDSREGELTKLRAMVVSEPSLADRARELGLGEFLRLSRGESNTGGDDKASILADAYEALVGAVFLDGGFQAARRLLWRHLEPTVAGAVEGDLDQDHKGLLQEVTQARWQEIPSYKVLETRGPDHDKTFVVAVQQGERVLAMAEGHSKKSAEQEAARVALGLLQEEQCSPTK